MSPFWWESVLGADGVKFLRTVMGSQMFVNFRHSDSAKQHRTHHRGKISAATRKLLRVLEQGNAPSEYPPITASLARDGNVKQLFAFLLAGQPLGVNGGCADDDYGAHFDPQSIVQDSHVFNRKRSYCVEAGANLTPTPTTAPTASPVGPGCSCVTSGFANRLAVTRSVCVDALAR